MKHMIIFLGIAAMLTACGGSDAQTPTASATPASSSSPPPAATASGPVQIADMLDRSSSIAGPDANADGVRDDINAWIDAQSLTAQQNKAVTDMAKALQQSLLVNAADKNAARAVAERSFNAMDCIDAAYDPKSKVPRQLTSQLEAMTANTRERAQRYIQYNAALGGMAFTMPDKPTCD